MKITRSTNLVRATWLALPPLCRWILIAWGRRPGDVTLGELRAIGGVK